MEATGTTSVDVSEPVEAATDVSDATAKPKVTKPWLSEWCEVFTPEQRMVMMASFWNVMEQETRGKAARRLVGILTEGEPALAGLHAGVKGGDFGTLRLDTSVYDHVSRPARCACNRATCDTHHTTVPCVTTAYVCDHSTGGSRASSRWRAPSRLA